MSCRPPAPPLSCILLTATLSMACTSLALAQTVDTTLWIANGPIQTIVRDGATIYIGGLFSQVGPATGCWVPVDQATGIVEQPFPKVTGTVSAAAPDGSGGWYLAGAFSAIGGQPRNNLAHVDANGNLLPWNPNAN